MVERVLSSLYDLVNAIISPIIGEVIGFTIAAFILGLFLRHRVEDGLKGIGRTLSNDFRLYIVPEIVKTRLTAQEVLRRFPVPREAEEEIEAPQEIEEVLKNIEEYKESGDFAEAERKLLGLRSQHPEDFKVLDKLFSLYTDTEYNKKGEALDFLVDAEENFKEDPRFYGLLARAYMGLKGIMSTPAARKNALDAANKCIQIDEENPKQHKLLGLVYYWFDDIEQAISITEKALQMAKDQKNAKEIASCKNNLAFYYTIEGKPEKKQMAFEYANAAYESNRNSGSYLDTLGYVKMKFATTVDELREAIDLFNKALELAPLNEDFIKHLQEAYKNLQKRFPSS